MAQDDPPNTSRFDSDTLYSPKTYHNRLTVDWLIIFFSIGLVIGYVVWAIH